MADILTGASFCAETRGWEWGLLICSLLLYNKMFNCRTAAFLQWLSSSLLIVASNFSFFIYFFGPIKRFL